LECTKKVERTNEQSCEKNLSMLDLTPIDSNAQVLLSGFSDLPEKSRLEVAEHAADKVWGNISTELERDRI